MNETHTLAQKCLKIQSNEFSAEIIDRVRYFLLDFLGVACRGARNESGRQIQKAVSKLQPHPAPDDTLIYGTSLRSNPALAALANGTAAHSLELDDVINEASLHPGVVIMPAVLAAAATAHSTAADVFAAIVTGYEVMTRLGIALNPGDHYKQGFHPTGTCGAFGAAAAAGKILKLNETQLTNALGIAGSQTSGSLEFLTDGSYTKRFHAGWAAHSGFTAAFLAREGFTGPRTILEGRFGFLQAYSPGSDPELLLKNWGEPYALMRTSIKPHACCRYKQGPIDGLLQIMRGHNLTADEVASVCIDVLEAGYALVAEPLEQKQQPQRVVDAQFSMPFGAASAILYGKAGLDEYTDEVIQRPEVKEFMPRVRCQKNPDLDREFPRKWPAIVRLHTKQGQTFSARIDFPKGDPENPLTWDELTDKFHDLTHKVYDQKQGEGIIRKVRSMEQSDPIDFLHKGLL